MRRLELPRVFVNGTSYAVIQRPGYIKADLSGYFGWTAVYADDYKGLVRRIKQVRSGGQ